MARFAYSNKMRTEEETQARLAGSNWRQPTCEDAPEDKPLDVESPMEGKETIGPRSEDKVERAATEYPNPPLFTLPRRDPRPYSHPHANTGSNTEPSHTLPPRPRHEYTPRPRNSSGFSARPRGEYNRGESSLFGPPLLRIVVEPHYRTLTLIIRATMDLGILLFRASSTQENLGKE